MLNVPMDQNNLEIIFWNCRAMSEDKVKLWRRIIRKENPDVFSLMEAGNYCDINREKLKDVFKDYDFKFLTMCRQVSSGIIVAVRKKLNFKDDQFTIIKSMIQGEENDQLEAVRCEVKKNGVTYDLIAIYKPPKSIKNYDWLRQITQKTIIFGDFNEIPPRVNPNRKRNIENFVNEFSLHYVESVIPGEGTYKKNLASEESTLDLVLAHESLRGKVSQKGIGYPNQVDHKAIKIVVKIEKRESQNNFLESSNRSQPVQPNANLRYEWEDFLEPQHQNKVSASGNSNPKKLEALVRIEKYLKSEGQWHYANEDRPKSNLESAIFLIQNCQDSLQRKTPAVVVYIKINLDKVFHKDDNDILDLKMQTYILSQISSLPISRELIETITDNQMAKKIFFNIVISSFCNFLRSRDIEFILTLKELAIFSYNESVDGLEIEMNKVVGEFVIWKLKSHLNRKAFKVGYQMFTHKTKPDPFTLKFEKKFLHPLHLIEFQGVVIDTELKFEEHSDICLEKAEYILKFLKDFLTLHKINIKEFKLFYIETILPTLMIGQEILICAIPRIQQKLKKIQRELRIMIEEVFGRNFEALDDSMGSIRSRFAIELYDSFSQADDSVWKNYVEEETRLERKNSFLVVVKRLKEAYQS